MKEFPCQSGGTNRGPLAYEADVLTTTLSDLDIEFEKSGTLYSKMIAQSAQWLAKTKTFQKKLKSVC